MGPSYSTHDPKGWCGDMKRGAAMGRHTYEGDQNFNGRITLRRVRLNSGGYDVNGTYFGIGEPLYWYASDDNAIDGMLRASSRAVARAQVFCRYPSSKVRR